MAKKLIEVKRRKAYKNENGKYRYEIEVDQGELININDHDFAIVLDKIGKKYFMIELLTGLSVADLPYSIGAKKKLIELVKNIPKEQIDLGVSKHQKI